MRRHRMMVVPACAVALGCAAPLVVSGTAQAEAVTVAGTWRRAIEVPGTGELNTGGGPAGADVQSMSCGSAGNCAAVGDYTERPGHTQVFVANYRQGMWHRAVEIPGTGALNKFGQAGVQSVSCASAGNCLAGGYYTDRAGHRQAFVASERDGTWRRAIEVPGTGALNKGIFIAEVDSVSCASAGNCVAGGTYTDRSRHTQVFVASERDGTWRRAIEMPGIAALNTGTAGTASLASVSCPSAGGCAAGGSYTNGAHRLQAFVATERDGRWRTAIEVPGIGSLENVASFGEFGAEVDSVSCGSAGNCLAGGRYLSSGEFQAFVGVERNGTWRSQSRCPAHAR